MFKEAETVLVVDDEEAFLKVCYELLMVIGYRALVAKEGEEAIQVYLEKRYEIDIVLLDMTMACADSKAVYGWFKHINPDVKVLLTSSSYAGNMIREISERGCSDFIQKPFTMMDLSKKLGDILGRK